MASDQIWHFLVLVVLIGNIFEYTVAQGGNNDTDNGTLRCYSCADTGAGNRCDDYNTYKLAMDGDGNEEVKKTCEAPYDVSCMINTYQTLGGSPAAHIRDCSDGKTFSYVSFALYEKGAYNRLEVLNASLNNETACVWDGNNLVCLTLCTGNFCNGPILKEVVSGSPVLVPALSLAIWMLFISFKHIM